jgi:hypothetical protein
MTIAELTAQFTADVERYQREIANARHHLEACHTMLLKTQGALEALALLDSGQRPPAERRADAQDEGERETGETEGDKTLCKHRRRV